MNATDSAYYQKQFAWRDWQTVFRAMPDISGRTILDLGCGIGDLAAEFASRGARVIGIDSNDDVLSVARSKGLPHAEFRKHDLAAFSESGARIDGVWSSFTAAYFVDFPEVLAEWTKNLRSGGWIALIEIDDLFGHEPLRPESKALLESYVREALATKRYDFRMGRKLRPILEQRGFAIAAEFALADKELAFAGPAEPDVVDGWMRRLSRMKLLQEFCGPDFERVREDFIHCIQSPAHRSVSKVMCCIAMKRGDA